MERCCDDAFFLPLFFLSLFFFSLPISARDSPPLNNTQEEILVSLSKNLPSSTSNAKWNTSDPNPCLWQGVGCSTSANSSVVTKLDLSGLGLYSGANASSVAGFFHHLCRLDSLEFLDLSRNAFGGIPASFFSNCSGLHGLKSLNLSSNRLAGALWDLSDFTSLDTLDLSFNALQGPINSQLDGLSGLKRLNLSYNLFNGTMPGLGKHQELEGLVLSTNRFSGSIPNEIGHHRNLTLLDLSQNYLSGGIPSEIGELPKLQTLLLSSNKLGGLIPGNLSMIKTLSRFAANQNNFTGKIPPGITRYVRVLDLSYNQLGGMIPSGLLSSPNLVSVDLTHNNLEGSIPDNFLSQNLFRLRLGENSLAGSIPQTIGRLSSLSYLELNDNKLDSKIHPEFGLCKNLTLLNLASNSLQGSLPEELGSLQKLVVLKLQTNNFTGQIPDVLFRLVNLSQLNLSSNSFSGVIPSTISNLKKLSNLNLQNNDFNGSIPDTIGSMPSLLELQLGNNKLGGPVPRMPVSLGIALNLSNNFFNGSIPSYLGYLKDVEVLDLSNNSFTGEVPNSLTNMKSLTLLDLSNNQLSGSLPIFSRYVTIITSGNMGGLLNSSNNSNTGSYSKRKSPFLAIILSIAGAIAGLSFVALVFRHVSSKRFYRVEDEGSQYGENTPHIVNGCFITAHSIHRSSIDFCKTMEVVGNPGHIILKTRFSTYYKVVMPNGASYTVKKLNWTDKIFQLGSHERFGRELETLGKLSNTNIMVPLAYVLTEDSAYLLYEHVHKGTVFDFLHKDPENALDWPSRYSIMLGVAQGLTFLHGCTQPVLLLDLSTKSIRLKSLKEPQVGDIELCKVIDPSKSTGSLSTIAGSVGYIPPEYAYTMKVTMAGNVYSFGVVLLELLTGKPAVSDGLELAQWALSCSVRSKEREPILDSRIFRTSLAVRSQMLSVLKVALACVNVSPEARPNMRNALRMLFNAK
ncbi:hypothetical protein Cni_G09278 [Canna indica]|uniref:Protein kinase domain-containing protein n=1 Tax=Canna indica TaxID=4628 RepID=A0AAQ3K213_9LILI|nr:hypothetical protein Cni_G09278 [Canna indica]